MRRVSRIQKYRFRGGSGGNAPPPPPPPPPPPGVEFQAFTTFTSKVSGAQVQTPVGIPVPHGTSVDATRRSKLVARYPNNGSGTLYPIQSEHFRTHINGDLQHCDGHFSLPAGYAAGDEVGVGYSDTHSFPSAPNYAAMTAGGDNFVAEITQWRPRIHWLSLDRDPIPGDQITLTFSTGEVYSCEWYDCSSFQARMFDDLAKLITQDPTGNYRCYAGETNVPYKPYHFPSDQFDGDFGNSYSINRWGTRLNFRSSNTPPCKGTASTNRWPGLGFYIWERRQAGGPTDYTITVSITRAGGSSLSFYVSAIATPGDFTGVTATNGVLEPCEEKTPRATYSMAFNDATATPDSPWFNGHQIHQVEKRARLKLGGSGDDHPCLTAWFQVSWHRDGTIVDRQVSIEQAELSSQMREWFYEADVRIGGVSQTSGDGRYVEMMHAPHQAWRWRTAKPIGVCSSGDMMRARIFPTYKRKPTKNYTDWVAFKTRGAEASFQTWTTRRSSGGTWGASQNNVYFYLPYTSKTGSFLPGDRVTGGTSGATGRIVEDSAGQLLLHRGSSGGANTTNFANGETITGIKGGSATTTSAGDYNLPLRGFVRATLNDPLYAGSVIHSQAPGRRAELGLLSFWEYLLITGDVLAHWESIEAFGDNLFGANDGVVRSSIATGADEFAPPNVYLDFRRHYATGADRTLANSTSTSRFGFPQWNDGLTGRFLPLVNKTRLLQEAGAQKINASHSPSSGVFVAFAFRPEKIFFDRQEMYAWSIRTSDEQQATSMLPKTGGAAGDADHINGCTYTSGARGYAWPLREIVRATWMQHEGARRRTYWRRLAKDQSFHFINATRAYIWGIMDWRRGAPENADTYAYGGAVWTRVGSSTPVGTSFAANAGDSFDSGSATPFEGGFESFDVFKSQFIVLSAQHALDLAAWDPAFQTNLGHSLATSVDKVLHPYHMLESQDPAEWWLWLGRTQVLPYASDISWSGGAWTAPSGTRNVWSNGANMTQAISWYKTQLAAGAPSMGQVSGLADSVLIDRFQMVGYGYGRMHQATLFFTMRYHSDPAIRTRAKYWFDLIWSTYPGTNTYTFLYDPTLDWHELAGSFGIVNEADI